MDKARTIDTSLRMLTGDCIAAVKKKKRSSKHLDRGPIDSQVGLSHLQIIPWPAR